MKAEQRRKYLDLITSIPGRGLCNFCTYAYWDGECNGMYPTCEHPIADEWRTPNPTDVWQGGDCWLYKPSRPFHEIAAWVGIFLEGNIPHFSETYDELVAIIPSDNDREYYDLY